MGDFAEAEEVLLLIQSEKYRNEYTFISHLARCCKELVERVRSELRITLLVLDIMNKKPRLAWELYLKMETSSESFSLLQLISNDCYKVSCE
jgi:intraflagellar transport protein 56